MDNYALMKIMNQIMPQSILYLNLNYRKNKLFKNKIKSIEKLLLILILYQ